MSDIALLARMLRAAFEDDPWHGPAFRDLIVDLTPAQAAARPVDAAHSIWELVLHCDAWQRIVRMRLLGNDEEITAGRNWPAVGEVTPLAWQHAIEAVEESSRRLREMVIRQDPRRFQPAAEGYDERMHVQVLGSIAHLAHHGGQIALLRRAQGLPGAAK